MDLNELRLAVIGLGYVGLPLAVEFGSKVSTVGFDVNRNRIEALNEGFDSTLEVSSEQLKSSVKLTLTDKLSDIKSSNFYIVTVPTPIDDNKAPDLSPLRKASETIGAVVSPGDYIVFESTVYPGATEEVCIPIVEQVSGLKLNTDFYAGYSPERINPGDKEHRVTNILKVTSGSCDMAASFIDEVYRLIISAGTYKAESIRVAEAAKVIENTQRDVNIALVNELALIFNKMNIDTEAVLRAAGTKWNFLPFRPGLVGGHCIGVDPYYLTHKAQAIGYHPEMILAGRRINDGMGRYVASLTVKQLIKKKIQVEGAKILLMGLAFKENCPDIRNTKVIDVISELREYGIFVDVYDPWVSAEEALSEYAIDLVESPKPDFYDGIILAVAHDEFYELGCANIREFGKDIHVFCDLKYVFGSTQSDIRL
ncbi:Vi polysaccharide biosynthesis UDP-N-acetylglucosamine C-6 dehydrogenase TviB [uncultured Pseudoteredinibacter sp.]|uniref:Vi polysaccharide biosynthesis UDP-N-acetylglucosamine C-6 dehydrogenase TviB n=1 Tax=uncultured Pseudoteredinibacter sp. TaxID=1641701 RepID=UPI00262CF2DC|nr:Vi polysaccharide biosynthesis UDP-N-acetylglucosamine C-6 dehydrogenase TviB [uncultured Pseudoteredinibacter sp.]